MHRNVREFLEVLRREGELLEIEEPVDPYLEAAEIHRQVIAQGGRALYFHRVKGSPFPLVTNLFGTARRVELAFGSRPERLVREMASAAEELLPPRWSALWGRRGLLKEVARAGVRRSRDLPVAQVVESPPGLTKLPALTCWPEDGGPFLTQPLVYTEHPDTGRHNLGMYRVQIFDDDTAGMHWQIHKGGGFHYHVAESRGEALPVTVFLGGPPALTAAAVAPLPEVVPELLLASLILGDKIPLGRWAGWDHPLIAEAEFAMIGRVPAGVRRLEGPFGDHYGYYSLAHPFPVFQVEAVLHRRDALFPGTVLGKPKQEDYFLGEFLQRLLAPLFPLAMPGVKDLWTFAETGFHPLCAAVVRDSYEGEALVHGFRILGEGQLSLTKCLFLTDQAVDVRDYRQVFQAVLERMDPAKDLYVIPDTPMDTLDYTGGRLNHGSKSLWIGTGKPRRVLPGSLRGTLPSYLGDVKVFLPGVIFIEVESFEQNPTLGSKVALEKELADWPVVVLVDDVKEIRDGTMGLWTWFTRFDPARDLYARTRLGRHRPAYQFPLVIDARMKPGYPGQVEPDPGVAQKVDREWGRVVAAAVRR
ncbi:UbiD family decarboxylase [Kyrpidia spormannii]|uniref:4-hydroxybenzoate decarboxylase n=1 Tax=Kyrpidia spormannii TaxID=2055160 RepID=A0A6F9EEV0_9BACL|nr:UbiD family decarboxylase [Kyrpidia spormannii]CAB3394849.1 conserved protein of unknown function [Kyrpidia spormannii]